MKCMHLRLVSFLVLSALGCGGARPVQSEPGHTPEIPQQNPPPTAAQVTAPLPAPPQPVPIAAESTATQGTFLSPLPQAVTSFGAAASTDTFYVLGGYFGTPHEYSKEGQSTAIVELKIGHADAWKKIGDLEQGLQGFYAALFERQLCHFGGSQAENPAGTPTVMRSVASARCFDLESGHWSNLPDAPEARSSLGGAIIGSRLYLAGGWTLSGDTKKGVFASTLLSIDLAHPEQGWQTMPAPFQRRAVGVAAVGRQLIVVGGLNENNEASTSVDIYDTITQRWSTGPSHPGDAFGISLASDGKVVLASGREGILRSWTPGRSSWTDVRHVGFGRFFHESRVVGDQLVIVGGIGGMHTRGRTRVVEKVPTTSALSYGEMVFNPPFKAKNRYGMLLTGEELYLFGGNLSLGQHDFSVSDFTAEGTRFDLATLSFVQAAPYPVRRQSMQTLSLEDRELAVGGFGHDPLTGPNTQALSHSQVYAYDWLGDRWTEAGHLPRGRTQFALVEAAEKIWILGGLNYDPARNDAFEHDTSIWVADAKAPKPEFREIELRLPAPRRAFASAVLNGQLYLIGGMRDNFKLVDDCLRFDFKTEIFDDIPCPTPRLGGDAVVAGGKLYLVSGSVQGAAGMEESRAIDVFDPKKQSWSRLGFEVPRSTRHMRAVAFNEQILMVSAHYAEPTLSVGLLNPGN